MRHDMLLYPLGQTESVGLLESRYLRVAAFFSPFLWLV